MNLISTAAGNHLDLHTTQGRYEYVGEFLNKHAANGDVWKCLTELHSRIAELEAAQQWHQASEPPEAYQEVLILVEFQYDEGHHVWEKGWHDGDRFHFCNVNCETRNYIVFGWRDLPPMPEVKK